MTERKENKTKGGRISKLGVLTKPDGPLEVSFKCQSPKEKLKLQFSIAINGYNTIIDMLVGAHKIGFTVQV